MSSAVRRSSITRSRRRHAGSAPVGARRRCDSTSRMMWSTSTSSPPGATSSASSSSNSSDSGFSLMLLKLAVLIDPTRAVYKRKGGPGAIPRRKERTLAHSPLLDEVVELKNRQQEGNHDEHDDCAHEDDHEWPQKIGHGREQAVHLAFLIRRRALEHLLQLAAA